MIKYKIDILQELKKRGYNTGIIRREKLLSENVLQSFRDNEPRLTAATLDTLCRLLNKQPGALLEWIPDGSPEKRRRDSIRGGNA